MSSINYIIVLSYTTQQHNWYSIVHITYTTIAIGIFLCCTLQDSVCVFFCRNLVKNLVLGYVHASQTKKVEVLQLIAKILEFSVSELEQACSGHTKGSWLGGLWRRTPSPPQVRTYDAPLTSIVIL